MPAPDGTWSCRTLLRSPRPTVGVAVGRILICLLVLAVPIAGADEVDGDGGERALDVESFDQVWTTIRDTHWDPGLGGLDWDAVRDELRPQVEEARERSLELEGAGLTR